MCFFIYTYYDFFFYLFFWLWCWKHRVCKCRCMQKELMTQIQIHSRDVPGIHSRFRDPAWMMCVICICTGRDMTAGNRRPWRCTFLLRGILRLYTTDLYPEEFGMASITATLCPSQLLRRSEEKKKKTQLIESACFNLEDGDYIAFIYLYICMCTPMDFYEFIMSWNYWNKFSCGLYM